MNAPDATPQADSGTLRADALLNDPRVLQARALLREAVAAHQQSMTGPRPPDPRRTAAYKVMMDDFAAKRGTPLYFPYLGSGFGRGPLVELADGSVKYDMIGGIGVHWLGHAHPALLEAGVGAALQDAIMQGNLQPHRDSRALAAELLALARAGGAALEHCFLTSSGAMANENALKIVFQKKSPADRLLAFAGSFAGRSMATAQLTDHAAYRAGLPTVFAVDYVPFFDWEHPDESASRSLAVLRDHLDRYPGQHAAMVFELVQGEHGFYAGTREFFVALMDELKRRQIAIFIDEIQTFGRLSEPFAYQHFKLEAYPDVVTVGKMLQACATLYRADYRPRPGLLSQTFTASTASIFAGRAILTLITQGDAFGVEGRNMRFHERFTRRFQAFAEKHPHLVRGPFGAGAMMAFTPLGGAPARVGPFVQALFQAGVISFTAGHDPMRVRFLMPVLALETRDFDAVCEIVEQTLLQCDRESIGPAA